MYTNQIRVDAIRTIDTIIETPRVQNQPSPSQMQSTNEQNFSNSNPHTKEQVQQIVKDASKALEVVNTELSFHIHEGTGRPVIQLVELVTNEVIREIPPEKMLDILAGIWEWAGLFVDRKE